MAQQWRNPLRYYCDHTGCEKSFIRKEHLTRHQLTHGEAPSYKCPICEKAFTRNDVLQKHIKNHTAPHDSTARNKRACYPCHRAKTRCAGGTPCLSCVKRSISEKCYVDAPVKKIEPDVKSGIGRALGKFEGEDREIPFPQTQEPSSYAKNLRDPGASYGGTLGGYKNEGLDAQSRGASSGGSYGSSFVSHGGGFTPHIFQQALVQQQHPTPADHMDVDSPTHYSLQAAFQSQLGPSSFAPQHFKRPIPTFRHEAMTDNEPPRQYRPQGCLEPILRQIQHRDETQNDSSFSYPPASTSAYTPSTLTQFALADAGSYDQRERPSSFSTRDERYSPTTSTQTPSAMNHFTSFADMGSYVYRKPQQYLRTSTFLPPPENQKPPKAAQAPQPPQCDLNSGYRNRVGAQPIDIEAGELYFRHFHPMWPIIHMPSYKEGMSKELDISVVMIGNFFKGTRASRMRALVKHDRLVASLLPKLSTIPLRTDTNDEKTWADFHASLINVIFAFYTGDTTLISQAILMLSTIITAMRELKLFQPPELKPDHFPPHATKLAEQRKRLAIAVFQIDTYLSIYRSKRQTLHPSELRFTLPHIYAIWNSRTMENLDDWLAREPHYRSHTPIRELFGMPSRSPWAPPMPVLLPKDIQLALCGLQQQIWDCLEKARELPHTTAFLITPEKRSEKEEEVRDMREHLQQQLDWWKRELDLVALCDEDGQLVTLPRSKTATSSMSEEEKTAFETLNTQSPPYRPNMSFESYAGLEDREQPNWKDVILSRPRALIFDTLHLYHLLSIHLHTDVASLDRLAELRAERGMQPQIPNEGLEEVALQIAATKWASPPGDTGALEAVKHVPAIVGLNLKAHGGGRGREGGSRATNAAARQAAATTTLPKRDWKQLRGNLDEVLREADSDTLGEGRSTPNEKEDTPASSRTTGQSWKTAPRSRSPKKAKIQPATRMPATSLPYIYTGPNTQGYPTGPLPPSDEFVSRTPPPATQVRGSQPSDEGGRGTFAGVTVKTITDQGLACKSYGSTARERSRKVGSPKVGSPKVWTETLATCMEPAGTSDADFPTTTVNHPVVNMALYTSALVLHEWRVNGGAGGVCKGTGKCGDRPVRQPKLDEGLLLKCVGLCGCGVEEGVGMLGGWLGGGGWKEEGGNGKDNGEGGGCQEEGSPPGGVEGAEKSNEGWCRLMHKLKQPKPNPKGDCIRNGEAEETWR